MIKNNPLKNHAQALPAAKASLAANLQGRYWEYHDLLYKHSRKLDDRMFVKFATDLQLDVEKFNTDRNSDKIADWIKTEMSQAAGHNLRSVPAFVANGVVIRGAKAPAYFKQVIELLLKE